VKQRKETKIESAFNIDALISFHRGMKLREHPATGPYRMENGVVYDYWQLVFLEEGHYTCRIEGCSPESMEERQILICEPRKIRFTYEHSDAVIGIINIRCGSPCLKQIKNRIFTLKGIELDTMHQILDTGTSIFCKLPEDSPFAGQQPLTDTADYQLQLLKNRIEFLLIHLYAQLKEDDTQSIPLRRQNYYEAKFTQIKDYMNAHLCENLTVSDICRATGFSPSTVKRIFENQTDCGVIHFFLTLKIREAKRLLRETELTVTEISEQLGFSSIHYFSRLFKKFTGCSPTYYTHINQ